MQKILQTNTHPYSIICQSMNITVWEVPFAWVKITVWQGRTFKGLTKLSPTSDYGKLSGDLRIV